MTRQKESAIAYTKQYEGKPSKCGVGSFPDAAIDAAAFISYCLGNYKVSSILDCPCGDWSVMKHVHIPIDMRYLGVDINPEFIAENRQKYPLHTFIEHDIVQDVFRGYFSVCIMRDFLFHLTFSDAINALKNICCRWIIFPTFDGIENRDVDELSLYDPEGIGYRPLNMLAPPFDVFKFRVLDSQRETHENCGGGKRKIVICEWTNNM